MITFGILVAYCICIGTRNLNQNGASWRIPNVLTILFALILGVGIIFAPESPRWLFFRGRHEEAELSLARVRGVKVEDQDYTVRQTYEEMKAAVEHEKSMDKFRWIDCFSPHDKILYRTVLLSVLQAGQQLTGANYCELAWTFRSRCISLIRSAYTQSSTMAPLSSTASESVTRLLRKLFSALSTLCVTLSTFSCAG